MVFDCFLYNGEKELLEIRLNEMCLCSDWVTHVIVEANVTHTGKLKELYFEQQKDFFKQYSNIMYYVVDDVPIGGTPRELEKHQRNKIMTALKFLEPKESDTIIISDVDEIPRAKMVSKYLSSGIDFAALVMQKYAYWLNCLESHEIWQRAKIMKWAYLKDKTPEEVRNSGYNFSIHNAGWHYSWVCDPLRKLESFSHTELNTPENVERIKNKENIWNNDELKTIAIDLSHPRYLYDNQDKFKDFII